MIHSDTVARPLPLQARATYLNSRLHNCSWRFSCDCVSFLRLMPQREIASRLVVAVVENRELRLDGHTMRDVRTGTDVYAVYNMAAETKCPFRRPELPCSFYYGWDDNRTPPVCLVTHDSNTEEQGISRNSFEAFPICWSPG